MTPFISDFAKEKRRQEIRQQLQNKPHMGEGDVDPDIKKYTDFYGAASLTTNDMAYGAGKFGHLSLPATMGPIDYWNHGEQYATDMENISKRLELENTGIFKSLKNGTDVPGISDAQDRQSANYNFVNREQTLVQEYLDNIDSDKRDTFVRLNNDILNSNISKWGDRLDDDGSMYDFMEHFKKKYGEIDVDFGNQTHREEIGHFMIDRVRNKKEY